MVKEVFENEWAVEYTEIKLKIQDINVQTQDKADKKKAL